MSDIYNEKEYTKLSDLILNENLEKEILPSDRLNEFPIPTQDVGMLIDTFLLSEGSARLNLATFCQTNMDPDAVKLMGDNLSKNSIDKTEYPNTTKIEGRCINIIAHLWNAPDKNFVGTSTVGSSEACMLAGMAMKMRWEEHAKREGIEFGGITGKKPNLIMSSAYQVCWEKFATYWDVDLIEIPLTEDAITLDIDAAMEAINEYTIGIVPILGVTYTGLYDNVKELNDRLEEYNKDAKHPLYIHVDGASGGMFAPFKQPNLQWDFRLKWVASISTSGHKYGLVYPGIGWVLWKDKNFLPEKLSFDVSYLGGSLTTLGINFSRSASQILGQYYVFTKYGYDGITSIHERTNKMAKLITKGLEELGCFDIINDGSVLPIVCYKLKEDSDICWSLYDLSDRLAMKGWQVPTYPLPGNMENNIVQRIVCRADLAFSMTNQLVETFKESVEKLNSMEGFCKRDEEGKPYGFTH